MEKKIFLENKKDLIDNAKIELKQLLDINQMDTSNNKINVLLNKKYQRKKPKKKKKKKKTPKNKILQNRYYYTYERKKSNQNTKRKNKNNIENKKDVDTIENLAAPKVLNNKEQNNINNENGELKIENNKEEIKFENRKKLFEYIIKDPEFQKLKNEENLNQNKEVDLEDINLVILMIKNDYLWKRKTKEIFKINDDNILENDIYECDLNLNQPIKSNILSLLIVQKLLFYDITTI